MRCCIEDASRYSYFLMMDGCEYHLYWDPGGDRVSTIVWMGPIGLLHYFQHGEVEIRVEQQKSKSVIPGKLLLWILDLGIFC